MLQISTMSGLRGLGTAKEDAVTLQMAANRYATSVGKAAIATDGAIGPLTVAMVRAALQFLVSRGQPEAATILAAQAVSASTLAAAAASIADYLNTSMDAIRHAGGAPATSSTGSSWTEWFGITPGKPTPPTPPMPLIPGGYITPKTMVMPPMPTGQSAGMSPTTKKYLMIGGGALVVLIALVMLMPKKKAAVGV